LTLDDYNCYVNAHQCYVIRIIFAPVTLRGSCSKTLLTASHVNNCSISLRTTTCSGTRAECLWIS